MKILLAAFCGVMVLFSSVHANARALEAAVVAQEEPAAVPQGALIWQGFHHKWEDKPHRVSKFGSYFRHIDYDETKDEVSGEYRGVFRVGAYKDAGQVKATGTFVRSGALGFYNDYVDESCLKLSGDVGSQKSVTCPVNIDLEAAGLADYENISVILRGFRLSATSYSSGYNTRGFAVRVIPGARHGDDYDFNAWLSLHPAHAPDRPQLDDKCWEDEHCKKYRYEGRIYYTVVGVARNAGAIIDETNSDGTNYYEQKIKMSPNKTPERAPDYMRSAHIEGESGFAHGLVAIQGFSWHLAHWSDWYADGRYLRDLEMAIKNIDYDPERGAADFMTDMYFSNSGVIPWGFDVTFKMWNALIQFDDKAFEASPKTWFDGHISSGGSEYLEEISFGF